MTDTDTATAESTCEHDYEENMETYRSILASTGRKESTINTNTQYLDTVVGVMDGKDPVHWTEIDLQDLLLSDRYRDWAPSTQQLVKAILKSYWEVHNKNEMLPPNNYAFWRSRKAYGGGSNRYDALKAKTPTESEVRHVLDVCKDVVMTSNSSREVHRHMALYLTAAYGLRRMEVAGLRVCDVRIEDDVVHIEESKGDKSRDIYMDIHLDEEMMKRFMDARSSRVGHDITNRDLLDRASHLFLRKGSDTEQMAPHTMGKTLKRLASAILDRAVNAHAFRHAKAFHLLEVRGLDVNHAAQYLGHSNIQQTFEYSYPGVSEQREAFNNGNGNPEPAPVVVESAPGNIDVAVKALTEAYTRGDLSATAFAEAVGALSKGNQHGGA